MPPPVRVFTIERLNWRRTAAGWLILPGADRVARFRDRVAAEAKAREFESVVRESINPFRCGGPNLHYQTSLGAAELHDWFVEIGIDPPGLTVDSAPWADAWTRIQVDMTPRQCTAAWEALDRVRFFRVDEAELGRPLYLVAQPEFEYGRSDFPRTGYVQCVGSTPYMLVRTLATADDLCQSLHDDAIVRNYGYASHSSNPAWARTVGHPLSLFESESDTENRRYDQEERFAEHRIIDLSATRPPSPGQTLFVVLRRYWLVEGLESSAWRWSLTQRKICGRAVAAFDTLAAADAHMAALEAEARHPPSPFRFGPPHGWGAFHATAIWGILSELAPINFANLWNDYEADDSIWIGWWDRVLPSLTEDQIAIAWSLFESLRFYEVVEVEYRE